MENLSREDLNPYEETVGYLQLLALKLKEFPYFQELGRGDPSEQETAIKILNRFWSEKKRSAYRGTNNVISQRVSDTEIEEVIINVFKDLGKMTWESFFQNRLPLLRLPKEVVGAMHEGSMPYTKARLIAKVQDAEARKTLMGETTSQGLSVTQLRKRIKTFRSDDEIEQIANRLSSMAKKFRHSQVLRDKKKRREIMHLLDELENYATSSLL